MELRPDLRQNIYLLSDFDTQIYGNKLPSKGQVLKVLFHNIRVVNLSTRESAKLVIREVKVFWDKARLPTQKESRCIDKLLSLHQEWADLQKHKTRPTNLRKEEDFSSRLQNLFDIAHGDIIEKVDETRRKFLENQRRDGRVGHINNIEGLFERMEREAKQRNEILAERQRKNQMDIDFIDSFVELAPSESSSSQILTQGSIGVYSNISLHNESEDEAAPSACKRSRGNVNIFNEKVVAVLDKCEVTDRDGVHLVGAIAEVLNVDLQYFTLNRSSIHRYRQKVRAARAEQIKTVFQTEKLDALVLHWDGKLLTDLTKRSMVDRIPVVVTNGVIEKLLGVPALENSKGVTQANAVLEVLKDWGLCKSVKALCCDTTASNLGNQNGAAILLESLLQTSLLFLPCRHHIFELVLGSVFETKLPFTTGPNVPLFKNFREAWKKIDVTNYKSGTEDEYVKQIVTPNHIERIRSFAQTALENFQPRDDYKELLVLSLIFIGSAPSTEVTFIYPGAFHHARWMAKAIYCLKIFMFRDQYPMTDVERSAVRDTSIFIVMLYVEAWFGAPLASAAPNNDLEFLKNLYRYKSVDEEVSNGTLQKFRNHLWYLSAETAAMAFFDENVSLEVKRKMVSELSPFDEIDEFFPKRIQINFKDIGGYCDKEMDHFVSPQSLNFFRRFEIDEEFLKLDPSVWSENKSYRHGSKIVKHLKVVNDFAERGVRLFTNYNEILTQNEQQKQFILQIVSEYRKNHPDAKTETLLNNL